MSEGTARLTKHPSDPRFALLHIGPTHAQTMGRFAPARWAPDLKAFWVKDDQVDALVRFLGIQGITVADDRAMPVQGAGRGCRVCGQTHEPATGPLPECSNPDCRQPANRYHPPTHCPACGQPWEAVIYAEGKSHDWRPDPRTCPNCGTKNLLAFAYCHTCGAELPALRPSAARPAESRPHLDNPQPIGEAITEWVEGQQPKPDIQEPAE